MWLVFHEMSFDIFVFKEHHMQSLQNRDAKSTVTTIICDWILEKRSKSHIRSSEMNGFKELKPA